MRSARAGARVEVDDVDLRLGGRRVVVGVSLTAEPGEVVGIVGPNGSGKSTVLRAVIGLLTPDRGRVLLDGTDLSDLRPRQVAQMLAAVLQDTTGDFDLTARDVVAMGRACFKRAFERDDPADHAIVDEALDRVDAGHLGDRPFALMSGGERQRVLIARALAQQPKILVMDEPTNHLDVRNQFDVLALPRALGVTAVIALHDLNLAAHYCDRLLVLHHGAPVASGTPWEVLGNALLRDVYGVEGKVIAHPGTGRPHVLLTPAERGPDLLAPSHEQNENAEQSRTGEA